MSKPTVKPPSPRPAWGAFVLIGLLGTALGATLTWVALRSDPAAPTFGPAATMPAANPDPTTHRPDPSLTAGQPPAQADRTLGNFYYDHHNWEQAVQHYQAAITQGSDDADIRTDLGNAYRFSGRPEDALAQYELAQKMNPRHEFSLFNQGGLFLEDLHQPDRAVAIWQTYLARFPEGSNVGAARQLIAQAQGPAAPPALGSPPPVTGPTAPATSPADRLILQQIESARSRTAHP